MADNKEVLHLAFILSAFADNLLMIVCRHADGCLLTRFSRSDILLM